MEKNDNWLDNLVGQIVGKTKSSLLDVVQMFSIENGLPLELNKKQCAQMLGVDVSTFDKRFNCHRDFPRIENKREKYPRDAVIDWYNNNWQRTVVK